MLYVTGCPKEAGVIFSGTALDKDMAKTLIIFINDINSFYNRLDQSAQDLRLRILCIFCKGEQPFFMDFSLLSPLEFFVVPKNGDGRNNKPPAMRVRVDCYTKNHLSVYNRVVQAVLQKGKVIYGEERKFTCAYEMDVQISYRLHT